eukprot:3034412-Pyramimonas_sp.AAC.1
MRSHLRPQRPRSHVWLRQLWHAPQPFRCPVETPPTVKVATASCAPAPILAYLPHVSRPSRELVRRPQRPRSPA